MMKEAKSLLLWVVTLCSFVNLIETSQPPPPSDVCQEIVFNFGYAVSEFTLCSIANARPIHLCGLCVNQYVSVVQAHNLFADTTDEEGKVCEEYFTNLDRIEIVSEAFKYVNYLWQKANCNYCFQKYPNGTLDPIPTPDTEIFNILYEEAWKCFNLTEENNTCVGCNKYYTRLNKNYIDLSTKYGENLCLDIVDSMNTTRETWSQKFKCTKEKQFELVLHIGFGIIACIPVIFYILAFVLSNKQEAKVIHQKRLAAEFAVNSQSTSAIEEVPQRTCPPFWFPRERTLR